MTRGEAIAQAFKMHSEIAARGAEAPREIHRVLTEANKVIPDRVIADFKAALASGEVAKTIGAGDAVTVEAVGGVVVSWLEHLADAYVELSERMRVKSIELAARSEAMREASEIVRRGVDVDAQATDEPNPGQ